MSERIFNDDTVPRLAQGYRFQWESAQKSRQNQGVSQLDFLKDLKLRIFLNKKSSWLTP